MKILTTEEHNLLKTIATMEAEVINEAFKVSDTRGLLHLSNALTSFEEKYIQAFYGDVVLGCCSEYRILVVEILGRINEEYRDRVLSEIIRSKVGKITDDELFQAYECIGVSNE